MTIGRMNVINRNVSQLNAYTSYFKLKVTDKELKKLLSLVNTSELVEKARQAKVKQDAAHEKKMQEAAKAYETYLKYWREDNNVALLHLPEPIASLCNFYRQQTTALTHLRFNKDQNRVETSKGVQIPVEIAKRAYIQLNGCMEGTCNQISVPVMNYTITQTTKESIIAGCHTIPKEDVRYIAELLNW